MIPQEFNAAVVTAWQGKFHSVALPIPMPQSPPAPANNPLSEAAAWRNYALARTCLNQAVLAKIPRSVRVLEVGVDQGVQLRCLASMGFRNSVGTHVRFDVMRHACQQVPTSSGVQASALHLPFRDDSFDMVCTSGLMSTLCDGRLERLMSELHRVSRRWLWGWERFEADGHRADSRRETVDFEAAWRQTFSDVRVTCVQRLVTPMPGGGFQVFLLEKAQ